MFSYHNRQTEEEEKKEVTQCEKRFFSSCYVYSPLFFSFFLLALSKPMTRVAVERYTLHPKQSKERERERERDHYTEKKKRKRKRKEERRTREGGNI